MGGSTSKAEAPAPAPETPSKAAARFCITWAAWLAIAFYISVAVLKTMLTKALMNGRSVAAAAAAERTEWTSPLVVD